MSGSRRAVATALVAIAACSMRSPARLELGDVATELAAGNARGALARVEIRNGGAQALLLHGVRLDCGCRLASPLPDMLAGGERATLVVRCHGDHGASAASHELRVSSNDGEHPETSVRFTLPRSEGVALEPAALYFGYVALGASASREVALPPTSDSGANGALVAGDPELQIEERPPRAEGRRVVRIRFTPRQAGPFHGALAFGGRAGALPLSGVGYRTLLAFPAELTVPSELTAGASLAIALKNIGPSAVDVTMLEAPPGLGAELQTTTAGREFRLVLRTRGRVDAAGGVIRLRTSDESEPVLTIPVHDGNV